MRYTFLSPMWLPWVPVHAVSDISHRHLYSCLVVYIQKVPQELICKVCSISPSSYIVLGTPIWIFNLKEKMILSSTYFLLVNFKYYLFSCILPFLPSRHFYLFSCLLSQASVHCLNQRSFVMFIPKIWENNVKRFWVFISHCRFPGKLLGKVWDIHTHFMSPTESQSETPISLLHIFLLWLSQICPFTYFLPYVHVHCQNQPVKHKHCNLVTHIVPQLPAQHAPVCPCLSAE